MRELEFVDAFKCFCDYESVIDEHGDEVMTSFPTVKRDVRFLAAYGGRGGGKSYFFGQQIAAFCYLNPGARVLCCREIQNSIRDSSKEYIEDGIKYLGIEKYFTVQETRILTPGNGEIIFKGLQRHLIDSIKSMKGINICWIDEAQTISKTSWDKLLPTIFRNKDAQIWCSWNPENTDDPIDNFFRHNAPNDTGKPPEDAIIQQISWHDNPYIDERLRATIEADLHNRPDDYPHIWEGAYLTISDAQVFKGKYTVQVFDTPSDASFYLGVDWGYSSDPTCLVRCFIVGHTLYVDAEAYDYHVELDDLVKLFSQVPGYSKWTIRADDARPDIISLVKRQGIRIKSAGKDKIEDGIAFLKSFEGIVIHPRCENTAREFMKYRYKVNKLTDEPEPKYEDKDNHTIDALRYAVNGLVKNNRLPNFARYSKGR